MREPRRYPRTPHLESSRCSPGRVDPDAVPFSSLEGRNLVVEEKVDGADCGIGLFDGRLRPFSRGQLLVGGRRERHFGLLHAWVAQRSDVLSEVLSDRYVLHGAWMTAKHTVFYDRLPDLLLEFDVWDEAERHFLSTPRRRALLAPLGCSSVPVLHVGLLPDPRVLPELLGPSRLVGPGWTSALEASALRAGQTMEQVRSHTDPSGLMEGLYVKVEDEDRVLARYKWVRPSFLSALLASGGHWQDRPAVPNALAPA